MQSEFESYSSVIYLVAALDAVLDNGKRITASYSVAEEEGREWTGKSDTEYFWDPLQIGAMDKLSRMLVEVNGEKHRIVSGTVTLHVGETLKLDATLAPATARTVFSWSSSSKRVASVDEVSHVELSAQVTDAGVELEATVFAGSEVDVEYRFGEVDGTGAFVPFTDWSEEPTFLWQPEGHGSRTLRVEARDAANPDGTMRYGTTSVIW